MKFVNALMLNDIHIGAVRSAGTTIGTRAAIQQYLLDSVELILADHTDKDLIINGDLFDSYEVDTGQVLALYMIMFQWLTVNPTNEAHFGMGNHDVAKNSMRTSSFALFCKLLQTSFPDRVFVYDRGLEQIGFGVWIIPHCTNQDCFNIELDRVLDELDQVEAPGYLLLHANFDNNFAVEADHSLNVSEEQARKLVKAGWTLVFAHEHQGRHAMAGQVKITGNQWPTSVSDCLTMGDAQKDGKKYAHVITSEEDFGSGTLSVKLSPLETWSAEGDYIAMPWHDLQHTEERFIRIEGEATADESADVINLISRYRQKSDAYVITNSVKISGIGGIGDMTALSVEGLQAINVLDALCEELDPPEEKVVREMMLEDAK